MTTKKRGKKERRKMANDNHLKVVLEESEKHLISELGMTEDMKFIEEIKSKITSKETKEIIQQFNEMYVKKIKDKYQKETSPNYDKKLFNFIKKDNKKI